MRTLRYVSLLYTGFFFIEPYFRHDAHHWMWFGLFYAAFLALYFAIPNTRGRVQQLMFGLLFVLGYAYFPFNESASGAFVYPVVMLAFVMRETRTYLICMALTAMGIALETWIFHLHVWAGGMGVFFCLVVGLSNLAYSRQQRATFLLRRAYDQIEHLAQVAERERIARDLHDLLGHTLTVIAIKSELANRLLERDPARAKQEMVEVEQTARKALADVREAVVGYRSEGIAAEVARAKRTLTVAEIAVSVSIAPIELEPAQANVLCLCLREAVTNIVRHAAATTCDVQLVRTADGLRFTVDDNGVGLKSGDGNGLRGMRERLQTLGGKMQIAAGPDGGTHLVIEMPLKEVSAKTDALPQAVHA